jgi:hypothetical protein
MVTGSQGMLPIDAHAGLMAIPSLDFLLQFMGKILGKK